MEDQVALALAADNNLPEPKNSHRMQVSFQVEPIDRQTHYVNNMASGLSAHLAIVVF